MHNAIVQTPPPRRLQQHTSDDRCGYLRVSNPTGQLSKYGTFQLVILAVASMLRPTTCCKVHNWRYNKKNTAPANDASGRAPQAAARRFDGVHVPMRLPGDRFPPRPPPNEPNQLKNSDAPRSPGIRESTLRSAVMPKLGTCIRTTDEQLL